MCLPFLPQAKIKTTFLTLKDEIIKVLIQHLNPMEVDKFQNFFQYMEKNVYSNEKRIKSVCKFGKTIRTTNCAEGAHSGFNKSSLVARSTNINSAIQGNKHIFFDTLTKSLTIYYINSLCLVRINIHLHA